MNDLQDRLGLSYLFVTHDLAVVRAVSTRVVVMFAGSIVEFAPKAQIYSDPQHPCSRALLDAVSSANFSRREAQRGMSCSRLRC